MSQLQPTVMDKYYNNYMVLYLISLDPLVSIYSCGVHGNHVLHIVREPVNISLVPGVSWNIMQNNCTSGIIRALWVFLMIHLVAR